MTSTPPLKRIQNWLQPLAQDHDEAFRERNIRLSVCLGFIIFSLMMTVDLVYSGTKVAFLFHVFVFALTGLIAWAVHSRQTLLASRLLTLIVVIILIDPSVAYWSPGTVTFNLIFTFLFMLVFPLRELMYPVALNLGVYALVAFTATNPSPLNANDFYSTPVTAVVTTSFAHALILGLGFYIRKDQKERDRQSLLLEQQRVDVLRQFISNTSHDIGTPLTQIKTSLYLLKKSADVQQIERLANMEASVNRLESLLLDMIDMTRLDAGDQFEPERVDLHTIVHAVIDDWHDRIQQHGLSLDYALNSSNSIIWGDTVYLERAVCNIIENAVNFTPAGGNITVETHLHGKHIQVVIRDTGQGISASELPHVFERFYRGDKSRNTNTGRGGLGLAISQKVIELHHGSIEVTSDLGRGSTFQITLPLFLG